jgi:hypothetical protein
LNLDSLSAVFSARTLTLEVENQPCGSARLVLRTAPKPRQQVIELEQANRHEVKGRHVYSGAYCRRKGGIDPKIWYAECRYGTAERFVRCAEQHMREGRDAGREGHLWSEEKCVQVEVTAVRRAIVAAEIRHRA